MCGWIETLFWLSLCGSALIFAVPIFRDDLSQINNLYPKFGNEYLCGITNTLIGYITNWFGIFLVFFLTQFMVSLLCILGISYVSVPI